MAPSFLQIEIGKLLPDPSQPRKTFLEEEIKKLAASIDARGILQPLRVRPDTDRDCWWLVAGERRWRAAKLAGLTHVPCVTVVGELSEADLLADQLIENTLRDDLPPLELARGLVKLKSLKRCNSQQLAAELGLSGAAITRAEALLSLPVDVQNLVDDRSLGESVAYEISRLEDEEAQRSLALAARDKKLNREQVIEAVRAQVGKKHVRPKASRVTCRIDGVSVTLSAAEPLTWDALLSALDATRKTARKLCDSGQDVTAFNKAMRA